jgi:hypothetical protein
VTDSRGQFLNTEEGERPPLKAVFRGLAKTQLTEKTECCIILRVCEITISLHLIVVANFKSPINSVTKKNPVYSHPNTWQCFNIIFPCRPRWAITIKVQYEKPNYKASVMLIRSMPRLQLTNLHFENRHCVGQRRSIVVETQCYKPDVHGFETVWGELNFFTLPNSSSCTRPWGSLTL